eukprot:Skav235160  [mRNA]  locus=scaffold2326:6037:7245:- [translate_table: standard]
MWGFGQAKAALEEKISSCKKIFQKASEGSGVCSEDSCVEPRWSQLEGFEAFRKQFRSFRGLQLHPKVDLTLRTALALNGERSRGCHLELRHPRYGFSGNVYQLQRVLRAWALTDAHFSYHKDVAVLASTILAITNCEAQTYAALRILGDKFFIKRLLFPEMDPYRLGSKGQAKLIMATYKHFCPVTFKALRAARMLPRLSEIVAQWLRSFFCAGYDPERNSLCLFETLLVFMLDVEVHEGDPYRELRQISLHILVRNSPLLLVAARAQSPPTELEILAVSIKVRPEFFDVLKEMNSTKMSPWSTDDLASFLPVSLVAAWCCILELDALLPGSSLAIPAACVCIGMVCGYMGAFRGFTRPPKDVTWDPILWADDAEEKFPSDMKMASEIVPELQDPDEVFDLE